MASTSAGLGTDMIAAALAAAIRAPSPLNTQPWRFVVGPDRIEVRLDRARVLPVADPGGREARLSCGAALFNIRTSLLAQRVGVGVDELPDAGDPDLLAVVRWHGQHVVTTEDRALAAAIPRRSTYRRPFEEREVPHHVRHRLAAAAMAERAQLEVLDVPARYDQVATLIRRADQLITDNPAFRAEDARWINRHGDRPEQPEGVPHSALGPPPLTLRIVPLPQRYSTAARPPREFERLPLIAVLVTHQDGERSQLAAGQAMQRVLLLATSQGLSTSFLSHPIEEPTVKAELDRAFHADGHPQTLLRIGYGGPGTTTPRRPVAAVTQYIES